MKTYTIEFSTTDSDYWEDAPFSVFTIQTELDKKELENVILEEMKKVKWVDDKGLAEWNYHDVASDTMGVLEKRPDITEITSTRIIINID